MTPYQPTFFHLQLLVSHISLKIEKKCQLIGVKKVILAIDNTIKKKNIKRNNLGSVICCWFICVLSPAKHFSTSSWQCLSISLLFFLETPLTNFCRKSLVVSHFAKSNFYDIRSISFTQVYKYFSKKQLRTSEIASNVW